MAPAKLAEFRYGREEMLALFSLPSELTCTLPAYQEKAVTNAGLLAERPQLPLNLMGPMSEDEQRTWQKGANSDTSLRLYKKEIPQSGLSGPGLGRGSGERGRGRGRGFFDRHRAPIDDEEGLGRREDGRTFGRGNTFGQLLFFSRCLYSFILFQGGLRSYDRSLSDRGHWFERSNSTGQPGEEAGPPNGNASPRKSYSRAPFDDWRKPAPASNNSGNNGGAPGAGSEEADQDQAGGWRSGPSSSGRRWNAPPGSAEGGHRGGWRTGPDERKYSSGSGPGDREYHNGASTRWHRETSSGDGEGQKEGGR